MGDNFDFQGFQNELDSEETFEDEEEMDEEAELKGSGMHIEGDEEEEGDIEEM